MNFSLSVGSLEKGFVHDFLLFLFFFERFNRTFCQQKSGRVVS